MFLYKTQSSAKRRTDDLIFSGRSLIKMRNRTGPKTDPWGTPDRTYNRSIKKCALHTISTPKINIFSLELCILLYKHILDDMVKRNNAYAPKV